MRVAVHIPPDHPAHGGGVQGPAVCAYRLGRIRDGIDNFYVHSGETIPLDEFVSGLVEQAKAEFPEPGVEVKVERLIDNGDGTASWIDAEDFDADEHTPAGAGEGKAAEINVQAEASV
jgi:hypothetical protein